MSAHHSLTAEQHLTPQSDAVPAPVTTTYVGRRRALGTAPEEPPWPMYIGKRRAVLDESTRQASHVASGQSGETAPSAASALTDRSSSSLPPDIAGVSASLEPIDHTTSWASDETVVLPRVQAYVGGRRRAARPVRSVRHSTPGRILSLPVLLGLASITVSIVGVITGDVPDSFVGDRAQIGSIGAMNGTDAVGAARPDVVSRSSDRERLGDVTAAKLGGQVDLQAEQRAVALKKLTQLADQRSRLLAANRWQLPLSTYRLTATFGEYGLWSSYHTGLDFAAPAGTPLLAMARGVITSAGYSGAYGNRTVLTLEDGTELWYAHQTSIYASVGDQVSAGDVVGSVGSTGNVTGPHLHLEVRPGGGDPVDPYAALIAEGLAP